jgi:hypothetical protein
MPDARDEAAVLPLRATETGVFAGFRPLGSDRSGSRRVCATGTGVCAGFRHRGGSGVPAVAARRTKVWLTPATRVSRVPVRLRDT